MKSCSKCHESKSLDCFGKTKAGYIRSWCKACFKSYQKDYSKRKPESIAKTQRKSLLKLRYGLTQENFDDLLKSQNNVCAICNSEDYLHIDHCHVTNKVRGLLCPKCNTGLGLFKDNETLLKKAAEYLCTNRLKGNG